MLIHFFRKNQWLKIVSCQLIVDGKRIEFEIENWTRFVSVIKSGVKHAVRVTVQSGAGTAGHCPAPEPAGTQATKKIQRLFGVIVTGRNWTRFVFSLSSFRKTYSISIDHCPSNRNILPKGNH